MAIVSWHPSLPWRPIGAGFQFEPGASFNSEDTAGGLPLLAEADAPRVSIGRGTLQLTLAQMGTWESWWQAADGLDRGRAWVWYPDPRWHGTALLAPDGTPYIGGDGAPVLRTAFWLATIQAPAQAYVAGAWWRLPLEIWVWP